LNTWEKKRKEEKKKEMFFAFLEKRGEKKARDRKHGKKRGGGKRGREFGEFNRRKKNQYKSKAREQGKKERMGCTRFYEGERRGSGRHLINQSFLNEGKEKHSYPAYPQEKIEATSSRGGWGKK